MTIVIGAKLKAWVWFILRFMVGFIFAYAGFAKLLEPIENFETALRDYEVFPTETIGIIARTVPWMESFAGSFLLLGYLPRQSAIVTAALAFGFVTLLGFSMVTGHGAEHCGCFGESGIQFTTTQMFFLDLCSFVSAVQLARQKVFPISLHSRLS